MGKGYDPEQTELVLPSCDLVGQWQQSQRQVFIGQLLVTPNGRHCSNAGRKINKKRVVTTRVSKWPGRGVDNGMRGTGSSSRAKCVKWFCLKNIHINSKRPPCKLEPLQLCDLQDLLDWQIKKIPPGSGCSGWSLPLIGEDFTRAPPAAQYHTYQQCTSVAVPVTPPVPVHQPILHPVTHQSLFSAPFPPGSASDDDITAALVTTI